MKLRDYQLGAVDGIESNLWFGTPTYRSTLLPAPTGIGKTVIFAEVIRRFEKRGTGRVLVVAHRTELLDQARRKIREHTGLEVDLEQAKAHADKHWFKAPVVVTSVQTQTAGRNGYRRMQGCSPMDFGLVILDEAHHAVSPQWRAVINHYQQNPDMKMLGVTATPNRSDEQALGQIFESFVPEIKLLDCIDNGWLVDINRAAPRIDGYDLSGCNLTKGDFRPSELAQILEDEKPLWEMAKATFKTAGDRRTLVFCVRVEHARSFSEMLNRPRLKPGCARYVSGKTPDDERRVIIRDYRAGVFQFLVNVYVATEGFDVPEIACVAVCRPTKSKPLFQQMVGRGMRPVWDGVASDVAADRLAWIAGSSKPDLTVIDFCGNFGKHNVCTALDVLGGDYSDEDIVLATQSHWDDAKVKNVRELLRTAHETNLERYKERMAREAVQAERRQHLTPDVAFTVDWSKPLRTLDLIPPREPGWYKGRRPSDKQIAWLLKQKVESPEALSFHEAHVMVGELIARRNRNECTYAQARVLEKFGYPASTKFDEARRLLDKLIGGKR